MATEGLLLYKGKPHPSNFPALFCAKNLASNQETIPYKEVKNIWQDFMEKLMAPPQLPLQDLDDKKYLPISEGGIWE